MSVEAEPVVQSRPELPPDRHAGPVSCVDMRADGLLASGGYDTTVALWSPGGRMLGRLPGHRALVNAVAFSPDGTRLASASSDRTALLWTVGRPDPDVRLEGHADDVNAVAWSPDARRVATASFDGTGRVWDAATGRLLATLEGHASDVNGVAWSPAGELLATASDDHSVRLWAPDGRCLAELRGHTDWVDAVAFSPDGRLLATASLDCAAGVFDVATRRPVAWLDEHGCTVKAVRFSPDGRWLATSAYDGRIRLFEVGTWQCVAVLDDGRMWNRSLAWGRVGRLATGSFGGAPVEWRVGEERARTADPLGAPGINAMALSPCGRFALLASDDGAARVVDVDGGSILRERLDFGGPLLAAAWSPDGTRFALGGWDGRLSIHDAHTGRRCAWASGHGEPVNAVAFSPDGRTLASGSFLGALALWDAADGHLVDIAGQHHGSIKSVAALPDGSGWVTGGRDGCVRIHTPAGARVMEVGRSIVNGVACSPDGKLVAAATRGAGVVVVELASGRVAAQHRDHPVSARTIAFSRDGQRIAAGHYDGHLQVISLRGAATVHARPFGATPLSTVAFRGAGTELVVATWDPSGRFGCVAAHDGRLVAEHRLVGGGR